MPYRLLKAFHKIQQRLVRELEKKFSGKDVVLIANRRILPPSTTGKATDRPRSRTLTAVCVLLWEGMHGRGCDAQQSRGIVHGDVGNLLYTRQPTARMGLILQLHGGHCWRQNVSGRDLKVFVLCRFTLPSSMTSCTPPRSSGSAFATALTAPRSSRCKGGYGVKKRG